MYDDVPYQALASTDTEPRPAGLRPSESCITKRQLLSTPWTLVDVPLSHTVEIPLEATWEIPTDQMVEAPQALLDTDTEIREPESGSAYKNTEVIWSRDVVAVVEASTHTGFIEEDDL